MAPCRASANAKRKLPMSTAAGHGIARNWPASQCRRWRQAVSPGMELAVVFRGPHLSLEPPRDAKRALMEVMARPLRGQAQAFVGPRNPNERMRLTEIGKELSGYKATWLFSNWQSSTMSGRFGAASRARRPSVCDTHAFPWTILHPPRRVHSPVLASSCIGKLPIVLPAWRRVRMSGGPGGTRTPNQSVMSALLYTIELQARPRVRR